MELKNNNQFNKNSLLDYNKNDEECPVKNKNILFKFRYTNYPIYYAPRQHNENLLRLANYNLFREGNLLPIEKDYVLHNFFIML